MPDSSIGPSDLTERFLRGETDREENRAVVRRLLREPVEPSPEARRGEAPADVSAYAGVFERVLASARVEESRLEADTRSAEALADELDDRLPSPEELAAEIARDTRFRGWPLAEILRTRSFEAGLSAPERGTALARAALSVAEHTAGANPSRLDHDLLAAAWGQLGNALRNTSDFAAAAQALDNAGRHLLQGTGDPLALGRLLSIEASLATDRARFDDGIAACRQAARIFRRASDGHNESRMRIQEADLQVAAGDVSAAIACLEAALGRIDPASEPRLVLVVHHNLIAYLDQLGRHQEAAQRLPEARALALELGHRLDLVRLGWLEGRIAAHRGLTDHAEACFRQARESFVELRVAYDAALATLDLAGILAPRGRGGELRQLAEEMLPIFRSRDLHAHAQAALKIFCEAVRDETADAALVREVHDYLEASRHQPDRPFRASP